MYTGISVVDANNYCLECLSINRIVHWCELLFELNVLVNCKEACLLLDNTIDDIMKRLTRIIQSFLSRGTSFHSVSRAIRQVLAPLFYTLSTNLNKHFTILIHNRLPTIQMHICSRHTLENFVGYIFTKSVTFYN